MVLSPGLLAGDSLDPDEAITGDAMNLGKLGTCRQNYRLKKLEQMDGIRVSKLSKQRFF